MTTNSRDLIARQAASDLPEGAYVNLGIGISTRVPAFIPASREVIFHSENGLLGVAPAPPGALIDIDLINASKEHVSMRKGGSFMHHNDSFAIIRGRHLDYSLMGAFEVSATGDLANWTIVEGDVKLPAIGGAMDLAVGAKHLWILMEHCTRTGRPKIVERCRYPLTAAGVVKRIYTELAVLDVDERGIVLRELMPGVELERLQLLTEARIVIPT